MSELGAMAATVPGIMARRDIWDDAMRMTPFSRWRAGAQAVTASFSNQRARLVTEMR